MSAFPSPLPTAPAPGGSSHRSRRLPLIVGGAGVALLLAAVFTLGSLNTPFVPEGPTGLLTLFSVSVFVVVAFLVFGFVLLRSLLRLWADRRAGQMGSRFRTKMVLGAMGISLLPVALLFVVSYALLNRTLNKWFPRPLEVATAESARLFEEMGRSTAARLQGLAQEMAPEFALPGAPLHLVPGCDALWRIDASGRVTDSLFREPAPDHASARAPHLLRAMPGGAEAWQAAGHTFLAARAAAGDSTLVVAQRMPDSYLIRLENIRAQQEMYQTQTQQLKAFRLQMLLNLMLITLLLLFSTTWVALFLAKQVTVPVQALAEATREISKGNLEHRVATRAQDELGMLVDSFNHMTAQLEDSRQRIQEFNSSLQSAIQEIEQRRRLMETILENIPTTVLSLDPGGAIERANPSALRMFGEAAREARTVEALAGPEAARAIERLMRRSLRMGAVSQELEIGPPGRLLHAAVTVSSLGPRRANPGYVVVIDDLSELLHAQKAAAWQEVAQRIAHEIKNPLTPIQLSSQRLGRFLERRQQGGPLTLDTAHELESLVADCAGLIQREVSALGSLVDAFSRFARFPEARPEPTDLNHVVSSALEVFAGRLDGVAVRTDLAPNLPQLRADPELLRRAVVNLIDNAAEAMEGAANRELLLCTRPGANGETLEIVVADSGHGIPPQDKDRLFLPHFSTRARGTGLGLAIVDRIVAEHHGSIRVEDNQPSGARFVIRLPATEAAAALAANGTGLPNGAKV